MSSLPDDTKRHLHRAALRHQREGRVPGLAAAVARGGELLWFAGIGTTRVGSPETPGPDDQYLVGSNTKTFTAVMLMQLRDEGRLTLDDLLADHLPDVGHPVTVRQALAHVSGMQREPLGDVWDTLEQPDAASLVRGFAEAERVGRPHTRWHYSNLAYAVLGQVVEKLDGRPWVESLDDAVVAPARDAPDHGGVRRRRPCDGLLRAAVPRRTPGGAGAGPPRHDPGRGPRQHGARPGPLVGVRRLTP